MISSSEFGSMPREGLTSRDETSFYFRNGKPSAFNDPYRMQKYVQGRQQTKLWHNPFDGLFDKRGAGHSWMR